MNLFVELKRRNVFRVGAAYLVVAWLIIQLVNNIAVPLNFPDWVPAFFIVFLGIGFPVALIIAWAFELTPDGIKPTAPVNPEEGITSNTGQKLNRLIITGLCLVLVLVVTDAYIVGDVPAQLQADKEVATTNDAQTVSAVIQEKSIVVLPFRDLSPGGGQEWLADGISTEINTLLTRIPDLFVINTNSAFQLREQGENYAALRETLKVNYVLTGDLQRIDDALRLTVRLTNTASGSQLWADSFEKQIADVFALQEAIAGDVSRAMQISLATGYFGRLPGMTRNVEAYEEYLKGVQNRLDGETVDSTRLAIAHMERALALDPDYTMPSLQLYNIYNALVPYIGTDRLFPEREVRSAEAKAHVQRVTPEDPYLLWMEASSNKALDLVSVEQSLSTALEQLSAYGVTESEFFQEQAFMEMAVGRPGRAVSLLERARATDPLNGGTIAWLSEALAMSGQTRRAIDLLTEARTYPGQLNNPRYLGNLLILSMTLKDPAVFDDYVFPLPIGPFNQRMIELRHDPVQALAEIRQGAASNEEGSAQNYNTLAAWAAFFGDEELSLELLSKVISGQQLVTQSLLFRPIYAEVRKLEGFKQIMRDRGLVDYWRSTGNWGVFCHPLPDGENDFECI